MTHTPGPWSIQEHSWSRTGIYGKHIGIAALDIADEATEETQEEWQALMAANARLIAAAPELLAALQSVVRQIEPLLDKQGFAYVGAIQSARAAIAKASPPPGQ